MRHMQSLYGKKHGFFIFTVLTLLSIASFVYAEGDKPYLSQEYIDTMVQNVYYGFLSASESPSADSRQLEAINHAKGIVSKLKRMAQGDPNRRYVLWRVSELEHQIFLEEEEIILKKMYKMQKEINVLCDKFNVEIGKARPSFVNLVAIHTQMLDISPKKADELAWLIESRDRNISREVTYSLEKSLLAFDYNKAKEEFEYIRKNRKYLFVNDQTYITFEKRIRAKLEADDMVKNFGVYLKDLQTIVARKDCLNARLNIECLNGRLQDVHTMMPYKQYSEFSKQIKTFSEKIEQYEDSLVMVNLELVHAGKVDAAIDYMDKVLRKHRVSNEKIRMIDRALMQLPGAPRRTMADNTVDREMQSLTATTGSNDGFSFGDVQAKMRIKMDSVKAYQAEQARLAQIEYEKAHKKEIKEQERLEKKKKQYQDKVQKEILAIYTLLEQNKTTKAAAQFTKQRSLLEQYAPQDVFGGLINALAQAQESQRSMVGNQDKNQQKALQVTKEIYALLDKREVELAWSKFKNLRSPLERYLDSDEFARLESVVNDSYASFQAQQKPVYETTASSQPINNMRVAAVKTTPPSQVGLDNGYADFDKKQAEAQDKATQDVIEIYSLIEQKQAELAYQLFRKNQIPLKTYICKEAYDILEATVVGAYNSGTETLQ